MPRQVVTVRGDGIQAVLAPLLAACRVEVAVLVDVGSGMTLDEWARGDGDAEAFGATHADVVRALVAAGAPSDELVLSRPGRRHHVIRTVADPCGGRLAIAAVVQGSAWAARRAMKRLRDVPEGCLTAGPLPVPAGSQGWGDPRPVGRHRAGDRQPPGLAQTDPGRTSRPVHRTGRGVGPAVAPRSSPAPPSALPPARRVGG